MLHIRFKVWITGESLHYGIAVSSTLKDDCSEYFDRGQIGCQRGRKCRALAIRAVAVIAAGVIAPEPVQRSGVGLAVGDPVEFAVRSLLGGGAGGDEANQLQPEYEP